MNTKKTIFILRSELSHPYEIKNLIKTPYNIKVFKTTPPINSANSNNRSYIEEK